MLENSYYIVIGVVSGVLTAFFVSAASDLWTYNVLPLFRRWRYRGANISGEWKGLGAVDTPASGEWSEVTLTLKQDTRDLRGRMVLRDRSAGRSVDLNLQGAGTIAQGYVTLSLWPASKRSGSVATALLKVDTEAGALVGQLLYRNAHDAIDAINVSVHRAGSIAAPRLVPSMPATATASGD